MGTEYRLTALVKDDLIEPADSDVRDMIRYTESILDIFNWCDELGVVMTFGFTKQFDEYFINLNKDRWFKSVYISREILSQRPTHVYDLVLNAVKELNFVNEDKGDK